MPHLKTYLHVSDLHFTGGWQRNMFDPWAQYVWGLPGLIGHTLPMLRYLQSAFSRLVKVDPATELIVTGDLTAFGATKQFRDADDYLGKASKKPPFLGLNRPGWASLSVPGNHDFWSGVACTGWGYTNGEVRKRYPLDAWVTPRQQGVLLSPQDLVELQDSMAAAPSPEDSMDLEQAKSALAELETSQRRLLEGWLTRYPYSERDLAREMGMSRYRLRQRLVEAIGLASLRLASLRLAVPTGGDDIDRRVAEALWRDKLTADEVAARLGVTRQQVRNAYARNQRRIVQSITSSPAEPVRARSPVMSEESIHALISKIFSDVPLEQVVPEVTRQAAALVQYLVDTDNAVAGRWQSLPVERLACVYEAISRGMGIAEGFEPPLSEMDSLFIAHENDRHDVGRAFAEALVPALPDGLFPLLRACGARLRLAPRQVSEALYREPDVIVGGSPARALAAFGLTPSHIVVAADAVAMLVERAIDAEYLPREQKLIFLRNRSGNENLQPTVRSLADEASGKSLSRADITTEICAVASVEESTGEVLLDWLVDSGSFVKSLFSGFTAEWARENVLLRPMTSPCQENMANLYVRWSNSRQTHDAVRGLSWA
jgi:hypothetical protein